MPGVISKVKLIYRRKRSDETERGYDDAKEILDVLMDDFAELIKQIRALD